MNVFARLLPALFLVSAISPALGDECRYGEWITYKDVAVSRLPDGSAYLYQTNNTAIDADGAPNAYNPGNTGLDFNANAGLPDNWRNVLAADPHDPQQPFVQTEGNFAGNYVAKTSLQNPNGIANDPKTYVDASAIPYLVFPGNFDRISGTGRMGDLGFAVNRGTGRSSSFIVADIGKAGDGLGEMSIALAQALSGNSRANPRTGAGAPLGDTLYIVFPFSSRDHPPQWPLSPEAIDHNARALLAAAGGLGAAEACR